MIDFVGFINSASTGFTTQEKIDFLHDFTERFKYTERTADMDPQPTRAEYANNITWKFYKSNVDAYRRDIAESAATYTAQPDPRE